MDIVLFFFCTLNCIYYFFLLINFPSFYTGMIYRIFNQYYLLLFRLQKWVIRNEDSSLFQKHRFWRKNLFFFYIIITFNFQLNDIESKCLENNLTYSFVVLPNWSNIVCFVLSIMGRFPLQCKVLIQLQVEILTF